MKINWHEHLNAPAAITGPEHEKEFIAMHWYGEPGKSGDVHGTARYLAGVTHASVNFVCGFAGGEGHAYCLVTPDRVAYGQGDGANGYGNLNGISIENDPRMRPEDLEVSAHVVARIRRDADFAYPLRPHQHFTQTACPGTYMGQLGWISARANQINGQNKAPQHTPAPVATPGESVFVPDAHWLVEKGETLTDAAEWATVSVDALAQFNGIKNPNKIEVGERIWSPKAGFTTWMVKPGDTLSEVAEWYTSRGRHTEVAKLQYANGINNPNTDVKVGMRLLVP